MKRLQYISSLLILMLSAGIAVADDLTADITHADPGENNGYIILNVSGGTEPYDFYWTGPDGFTATTKNIYYLAPGEYCVTVNDLLCGVATLCVTVEEETTTSLNDPGTLTSYTLYPDPFDDELNIQLEEISLETIRVELLDIFGRVLLQYDWPSGTNTFRLEGLSYLPHGPCVLRLTSSNGETRSALLIR